MKTNIIAEIGINHFGKLKLLEKYVESFNGLGIDGISIQILSKKKTLKKFKNYSLKKKRNKKICKYCEKKV